MKEQEINELLRRTAVEIIPGFNENEWFALEFNHPGSNIFGVLSHCGGVTYGKYRFILDIPQKLSYNGDLFVLPNYQGQGLGRMLVEFRESVCKELVIEKVVINNDENPTFWQHLGYKPINLVHKFYLTKRKGIQFGDGPGIPTYKRIK